MTRWTWTTCAVLLAYPACYFGFLEEAFSHQTNMIGLKLPIPKLLEWLSFAGEAMCGLLILGKTELVPRFVSREGFALELLALGIYHVLCLGVFIFALVMGQ